MKKSDFIIDDEAQHWRDKVKETEDKIKEWIKLGVKVQIGIDGKAYGVISRSYKISNREIKEVRQLAEEYCYYLKKVKEGEGAK